jgi:hypothetical protein
MHIKQQNKGYNKELTTEFNGMSDPFKIAMAFAKRKAGECVPGNQHNFVVQLACCLNRMGISEAECTNFVQNTLKIDVSSNCVSFPYRAYSASFGIWNDWNAKPAPSLSQPEITKAITPEHTHTTDFFKALGFSKDESGSNRYYFYAYMSFTIVALTPGKMTKANLLQLAPLNWWAMYFPKGESFHLESAINYLIAACTDAGFFSSLRLRGRGAWIDKDRVVIHTGRQLIINGTRHKLGSVET